MSDLKSILTQLRHIIKTENSQLRQGILTRLQETIAVKQTLLVELGEAMKLVSDQSLKDWASKELEGVQGLLKENDRLMITAINSVKSAHKQLAVVRHTEKKVGAYNRFGKTVYMSDGPGLKTKLI